MDALETILTPTQLEAAVADWRRQATATDRLTYDEATYRPWVDSYYAGLGKAPPAHLRFFLSPMAVALALDAEDQATNAIRDAAIAAGKKKAEAEAEGQAALDACACLPTQADIQPELDAWCPTHPRYYAARTFLLDLTFTQADAAFVAYHDALDTAGRGDLVSEAARQMMPLSRTCGGLFCFDHLCIILDRPSQVSLDEQQQLHATDGPAIAWYDHYHRCFAGRLAIPRETFTPGWLTAQRILETENAEERRVFMDIFGAERFIADLGVQPVDASDFGTLYKVELPQLEGEEDSHLCMLRVQNSSDEYAQYELVSAARWRSPDGGLHLALPDGTPPDQPPAGWTFTPEVKVGVGLPHLKDYWLRVPPTMERAREAVAWTFNLPEGEYQPQQES